MFTKEYLTVLWKKALRKRTLFTALTEEDRGFLYLTMKTVDRVHSTALGGILVGIIVKLRNAMKSGFVRMMDEFGYRRAREITRLAVDWGYDAAKQWSSDIDFIRFLTFTGMNNPPGFGVQGIQ